MNKHISLLDGKTIRDSVHGDIFLPDKFIEIIDTPEFQRLRRINQLSVSYLVFPSAHHTRFSHSIGTYFIMQKIINHFKPIMKSINLDLKTRDIDLALASALLHDIGHGPFSHTFERAIPNNIDHEQWTVDIINNDEGDINKVLRKNFDDEFPGDLADIIRKERSVKEGAVVKDEFREFDLFFILSSLISSQLDADRLDYLVRDSMYTGVIFGTIDIDRIISSMTITVYMDNYYVCVMDKFLSDVENYLLARYQMHKEVYLHDVKCEMELVIKKILERAHELYNKDKEFIVSTLPSPLLQLFKGRRISVKEYIALDDNILISTFAQWMETEDPILKSLCSGIINREKYKKLYILNNTREDIDEFKEKVVEIFNESGYTINSCNEEYFWIESTESYKIYQKNKENVWILKNDGTVMDISDVSKIIKEELNGEKNMTFINYDIIKEIKGLKNSDDVINNIKDLVKLSNNRNYIEIEKKYAFKDKSVFDKVMQLLDKLDEYDVDKSEGFRVQKDYYYDTPELDLFNNNKTLRFRKAGNKYELTIKKPTIAKEHMENGLNSHTQSERFEFEIPVESTDLDDNRHYIIKYLPELTHEDKWGGLEQSLTIINNRKKINLRKNKVVFEMVFDEVKYINAKDQESSEYQVEIELKSNYIHRINLKMLSDYLEENIQDLEATKDSKYKRGLMLTSDSK